MSNLNPEEPQKYSGHTYDVQVNLQKNKTEATVTATPTPYNRPPDWDARLHDKHHAHQDALGTKLSDSHFRPCLPNDGPLPSACTPRHIWRPCSPSIAMASGKESRTFDKLGSTWAAAAQAPFQAKIRDPLRKDLASTCSFDRRWVLRSVKRSTDLQKSHRAGKMSDIGGSLLFPGARISSCKPTKRPYGKNIGDMLEGLTPRAGDIYILPSIGSARKSRTDPRGYVGIVKDSLDGLMVEGGLMLLRLIKFQGSSLRIRKQAKLFLVTVDGRWRLKGMLHTCGYMKDPCVPSNYKTVPVRHRRALEPNTADLLCIPQRGDLIIREPWKDLYPHRRDETNALLWWQPHLELDLNDIMLRACMWPCCDSFEGFVDLYYYNGRGLRWVFLGRDETTFETPFAERGSDTSDDDEDEKISRLRGLLRASSQRGICANPCTGDFPPPESDWQNDYTDAASSVCESFA